MTSEHANKVTAEGERGSFTVRPLTVLELPASPRAPGHLAPTPGPSAPPAERHLEVGCPYFWLTPRPRREGPSRGRGRVRASKGQPGVPQGSERGVWLAVGPSLAVLPRGGNLLGPMLIPLSALRAWHARVRYEVSLTELCHRWWLTTPKRLDALLTPWFAPRQGERISRAGPDLWQTFHNIPPHCGSEETHV